MSLFVFFWAYTVTWIWTVDSGVCYDYVKRCHDFIGTYYFLLQFPPPLPPPSPPPPQQNHRLSLPANRSNNTF